MGHHLRLAIAAGRIVCGYQQAADLRDCVVEQVDDGTWTLDAAIVSVNTFWLASSPLSFVVQTRGGGVWRWQVASLLREVNGTRLSARLDHRERTVPDNAAIRTT